MKGLGNVPRTWNALRTDGAAQRRRRWHGQAPRLDMHCAIACASRAYGSGCASHSWLASMRRRARAPRHHRASHHWQAAVGALPGGVRAPRRCALIGCPPASGRTCTRGDCIRMKPSTASMRRRWRWSRSSTRPAAEADPQHTCAGAGTWRGARAAAADSACGDGGGDWLLC
jgi:hypothetical protein